MHSRIVTLALAAALAGCTEVNAPVPIAFQAELLPTSLAGVQGQLAAVSQGRNTQAGIEVQGAPSTTYGWQINEGTCANPGGMVGGQGAYPNFTTNDSGSGEVGRTFIPRILREENDYHGVVVDAATRQTVLACGNLETFDV